MDEEDLDLAQLSNTLYLTFPLPKNKPVPPHQLIFNEESITFCLYGKAYEVPHQLAETLSFQQLIDFVKRSVNAN
jgi:hypothetical protein